MGKILFIVGPTSVGKTSFALQVAQKYKGEIISADSRQVYKGMDILTGKDLPLNSKFKNIVHPSYTFNVTEYTFLAQKVIKNIFSRNKLPIVVGGTGFYVKSLIDPAQTLQIPPDIPLRRKYAGFTKEELRGKLKEIDGGRLDKMNNSDRNNPRRLLRAIEVAVYTQKNKQQKLPSVKGEDILCLGLHAPFEKLFKKIDLRVENRIKDGVIEEVKELISRGYDINSPGLSATGFNSVKEYLEEKIDREELTKRWKRQEYDLARRQMVWFKKQKKIFWFDITKKDDTVKLDEILYKWYTS